MASRASFCTSFRNDTFENATFCVASAEASAEEWEWPRRLIPRVCQAFPTQREFSPIFLLHVTRTPQGVFAGKSRAI